MPKKNSNTVSSPNQMSYLDSDALPELLSQGGNEWNAFPLQYQNTNGQRYYAIQDWIAGVALSENPRDFWGKLKKRYPELSTRCLQLPYESDNGRVYQMDHTDAQGLYLITQRMGAKTGIAQNILNYLAAAGVLVDNARRENSGQIAPPKNRKEEKYFARQVVVEHKDRGSALATLQVRREVIDTFKNMMAAVAKVCDDPRYGEIGNAEYVALFGYTAKDLKRLLNTSSVRDVLTSAELKGLQFLETIMEEKLLQAQTMTNDQIVSTLHRVAVSIRQALSEVSTRFDNLESSPLLNAKN